MPRAWIKPFAALAGFLALTIATYWTYRLHLVQKRIPASPAVIALSTPTRTDFGTSTPPGFLSDIPLEKGAALSQSYSLAYPGQKQLSIMFPTRKTIEQNYTLYTSFLKDHGWTIVNKYESATISSLYAKKQTNDINITIATNQVSLSALTQ